MFPSHDRSFKKAAVSHYARQRKVDLDRVLRRTERVLDEQLCRVENELEKAPEFDTRLSAASNEIAKTLKAVVDLHIKFQTHQASLAESLSFDDETGVFIEWFKSLGFNNRQAVSKAFYEAEYELKQQRPRREMNSATAKRRRSKDQTE